MPCKRDQNAIDALRKLKRVSLAHLPTPVEPLDRLSTELGGPRVWVKRDDCTGLATGGNKTRKIEFLMADALAKGADTTVTVGAIQSNHARQVAAASARLGIRCVLCLSSFRLLAEALWPDCCWGRVCPDGEVGLSASVPVIKPSGRSNASAHPARRGSNSGSVQRNRRSNADCDR